MDILSYSAAAKARKVAESKSKGYVKNVSPTVNDDINSGYRMGDTWKDTVSGTKYTLIDSTAGAANWDSKAVAASEVSYDNTNSGLVAANVEEAIDEVNSNTYTKAEIDAMTPEVLQTTGQSVTQAMSQKAVTDALGIYSAKGSDIYTGAYGFNWDYATDTYVRTGASGYTSIQSMMKRCVLNTDGSVNYYLDANDSTKKADGSQAVLDGTDGNIMVEIPKFYYKYNYNTTNGVVHEHSISLTPDDGYVVHPAFVRDGVELDYRYRAAYDGKIVGGKLMSISGVYPTTGQNITTFRTNAQANGAGWHQLDWLLHEAITLLCVIEYGTMNIQSTLGEGRTALSAGSWIGGSYIGITGLSNSLGNGSGNVTYAGSANDAAADGSFMSYRGVENFFGNIWKFADGVLFQNNVPYVNQHPSTYDSTTLGSNDISTGVNMSASSGYARNLGNSNKGFFPTSVSGGSSAAGTTDYFYANDAGELGIALVGADAGSGLSAGPLYLYAYDVASNVSVNFGGALSR